MASQFITTIKNTPVRLELKAKRLFGSNEYTGTLRRTTGELVFCSPSTYATAGDASARVVIHAMNLAARGGYSFGVLQARGVEDDDGDE